MPSPRGLHTGMPTGHPNSTVLISSPMLLRSAEKGRLFNQSRAGSPPASVLRKIAGTRLFSVADLVFSTTNVVYHVWYIRASSCSGEPYTGDFWPLGRRFTGI